MALLISCSTSKRIERAVNTGNYDYAISNALNKLRTNKHKNRKAEYVVMLQDAYNKANERDLNTIALYKSTNNPEDYIKIYDLYVTIDNRQERIKPLLPLFVDGKEVNFIFNNHTKDIAKAMVKASEHLYKNATALLSSKSNIKADYRLAHEQLSEIEAINPNYKDVRNLMRQAQLKGTDYVMVEMTNDTEKVIPRKLESDLLNFSTYGLTDFWTVYHNTRNADVLYDYKMVVNLRAINVSPEQIRERQLVKEKEVADGKTILRDEDGNEVRDENGDTIEVDQLKTVRCEYYEFTQFKAVQVIGNVEYYDLVSNQLTDAFPVTSEFVFEHIYANANGDRRALENGLLPFLDQRAVPFPTEEQMIYDSGENLKAQIKNIVNSYALN